MLVLAFDGSPSGGGRTATVLEAVLAGAALDGAEVTFAPLTTPADLDAALAAVQGADAFVLGSPVYRASIASPMKAFLDRLPRGMWGENLAPITGRAAAIVCTGATWHHYLALNDLRGVLGGFFAAHVLSPGLYVPHEGFSDGKLDEPHAALARQTGQALVALSLAIDASHQLRAIRPQA